MFLTCQYLFLIVLKAMESGNDFWRGLTTDADSPRVDLLEVSSSTCFGGRST